MNLTELCSAAAVVVVLVGWLAKLTWMFAHQDAKIGGIDSLQSQLYSLDTKISELRITSASNNTKIDTMWAYQMRRAFSEAIEKGVATVNSPVKVSSEACEFLEPIASELREFYQANLIGTKDVESLMEIEKHFGAKIMDHVSIPCKLTQGACLLLAFSVAKGDPIVKVEL